MKFRLTQIGAYLYHRRFTLSFSWRCRWSWLPERLSHGFGDGWNLWWGWFSLELLREGDDWGEEAGASLAETLDWLMRDIADEKPPAVPGGAS